MLKNLPFLQCKSLTGDALQPGTYLPKSPRDCLFGVEAVSTDVRKCVILSGTAKTFAWAAAFVLFLHVSYQDLTKIMYANCAAA